MEYGARIGVIPPSYANYRQHYMCVFDIECLEAEYTGKKEGMDSHIIMEQKLVSLAVGSNLPGTIPAFFCRESSQPEEGQAVIDQFIAYINDVYEQLQQHLPPYVHNV